jgi:hypothetical protein
MGLVCHLFQLFESFKQFYVGFQQGIALILAPNVEDLLFHLSFLLNLDLYTF